MYMVGKLGSIGRRYIFGALLMLAIGLWLNVTKPVWLAPPLFVYTPFIYVVLAYAWLLLLYYVLAHLMGHKKGLVLFLVLLIAVGQWFCWASLAPRKQIVELVGDVSTFSRRQCEYTSPEPGKTNYVCELRMGSSDDPREWVLAQRVDVWTGWPFMGLVESDFWIEE
jgi:hypothetical protein